MIVGTSTRRTKDVVVSSPLALRGKNGDATAFGDETLKQADAQTAFQGLRTGDDRRKLLVVPDQSKMLRLRPYSGRTRQKTLKDESRRKAIRTPFMMGTRDAGSVHIEASSRNTTGKSITFSADEAAVIQVVQICNVEQEKES